MAERQNLLQENITDATDAEDPGGISEDLVFAGYVCVNLLMVEKFLD